MVVLAACIAREVQLSSTQQASTIGPSSFNYGTVAVGSADTQVFTIQPVSGVQSSDTVTSITACPPTFTVTASLPGTVSNTCTQMSGSGACTMFTPVDYTFEVTFAPGVPGPASCQVQIDYSTQGPQTFELTGSGSGQLVELVVSPSAINLGTINVGTTSNPPSPVTITNLGTGSGGMLVSSVAFDPASLANGYAVSGPGTPNTLGRGSSEVYGVTCSPGSAGPLPNGNLNIATAGGSATVEVSCAGIESNLVIDPSAPAFIGTQIGNATRVGEPVDLTVRFTNSGGAPLTLDSLSLAGSDLTLLSEPGSNTVLDQGNGSNAVIEFLPTAPIAGQVGMVTVNYSDGSGDHSQLVPLSGGAFATVMSLDGPTNFGDFGPVCVGTSAMQQFSVMSGAPGAFVLDGVQLPSGPFTLSAISPTTLPSMATPTPIAGNGADPALFRVTAAPTATGSATSSFTLDTDIPNGSASQPVTLSVVGLAGGVTASPPMVDLGASEVGVVSMGQTVTLTNCGSAAITLGTPTLTGDASDFLVLVTPASSMVSSTENATYVVAMQASHAGTREATMTIPYSGGSASVDLIGTGMGNGDNGGGDKSYYTCSTGGGGALGGSLVAVGFVLVRRRRRR